MSLKPLPDGYLGMTHMEEDRELMADIGISNRIHSAMLALMTLAHELVHLTSPYKGQPHGPRFQKVAKAVGLRAPFAEVRNITPEFRVSLILIRQKLGPYPAS